LRAVTDGRENGGENGGQRDRALKWATRFIGRDG
jgi:hypothetical protein